MNIYQDPCKNGIYKDGCGTIRYYQHGYLHNEDGPAVIDPDNDDIQWHIRGWRLSESEFIEWKLKNFLK